MKKKRPEDVLEEYLNERIIPDDPELASLSRMADRLERGLNVDTPEANRERALFIQGVAARKPGFPWGRILVPVTVASMLVAFVAISREAQPGDTLYGIRKAFGKVGLAEDPARSAKPILDQAEELVGEAETLLDQERFFPARRTAQRALPLLAQAGELIEDGSGGFLETQSDRLEDLTDDANDIIEESIREIDDREEAQERAEERREEAQERAEERAEEREDNSGKGGGDDNSGPGGGDDSGGDDNSGPGSGDDSGTDDSSGSGSGSDSSGSGSGGDDDRSGEG